MKETIAYVSSLAIVLYAVIAIALALTGCSAENGVGGYPETVPPTTQAPTPAPEAVPEATPASPAQSPEPTPAHPQLTEPAAELLNVLSAGQQFVESLQRGEMPSNARDPAMEGAVSAFERFFQLDTLQVDGAALNPYSPESYVCWVFGLNEYNYPRVVVVYFDQGEPMAWHCPMVYYSAFIDGAIETYLGYLRDNDPYGLAGWLLERQVAPDDDFVMEAKKTTDYFNLHYDLSETFVRESETMILDSGFATSVGFVLTVEDANSNTFQVELVCGDGLVFPRLLK